MTFDEYMTRFRLLQNGAEQDERCLALLRGKRYRNFAARFEKTENPVLISLLLTEQNLETRKKKRQRLSERYAERIARAIALMEDPVLQKYALFRYLYGLTHEEIAEQSFFCVRTVYRHGKMAKKELEKKLLEIMPKPRPVKGRRFTLKSPLPKRHHASDRVMKSVAFSTARRNSLPYRPIPAYI